jgi:SAM-dependent methyltransferase
MQYELLRYLRCPVSKTELQFQLIEEFEKNYEGSTVREIKSGLLFSSLGFVFPVINGIPRMLVEAVYDYRSFLQQRVPDYTNRLRQLTTSQSQLLNECISGNKKTKKSFEWEWNFLDAQKKDKIWEKDIASLTDIFLSETGLSIQDVNHKLTIDVGSGHGLMTSAIASLTNTTAIGVELSKAVENAYVHNQRSNAWFVQADLRYLPFAAGTFDVLYSSGVIHHTKNTHESLLCIESSLKVGGLLCIWLYHPQKNLYHSIALLLRKVISKLPVQLAFVLISIFIFPFTYLIKKIKNKRPVNYREELIYLFDSFTPEFRDEVPKEKAMEWLKEMNYTFTKITTVDQYGYSLSAKKTTSDSV